MVVAPEGKVGQLAIISTTVTSVSGRTPSPPCLLYLVTYLQVSVNDLDA